MEYRNLIKYLVSAGRYAEAETVLTTASDFNTALKKFLDYANSLQRSGDTTVYADKGGQKYIRIVRKSGGQNSAYAFVEKSTGDVYKPATWKAPAKHARGNIYKGASNPKEYGVTEYGTQYLK